MNELIQPKATMPAHANEASTQDGKPIPSSKVAAFIAGVDKSIAVHLPLSGRTMECDGNASCVKGC